MNATYARVSVLSSHHIVLRRKPLIWYLLRAQDQQILWIYMEENHRPMNFKIQQENIEVDVNDIVISGEWFLVETAMRH